MNFNDKLTFNLVAESKEKNFFRKVVAGQVVIMYVIGLEFYLLCCLYVLHQKTSVK